MYTPGIADNVKNSDTWLQVALVIYRIPARCLHDPISPFGTPAYSAVFHSPATFTTVRNPGSVSRDATYSAGIIMKKLRNMLSTLFLSSTAILASTPSHAGPILFAMVSDMTEEYEENTTSYVAQGEFIRDLWGMGHAGGVDTIFLNKATGIDYDRYSQIFVYDLASNLDETPTQVSNYEAIADWYMRRQQAEQNLILDGRIISSSRMFTDYKGRARVHQQLPGPAGQAWWWSRARYRPFQFRGRHQQNQPAHWCGRFHRQVFSLRGLCLYLLQWPPRSLRGLIVPTVRPGTGKLRFRRERTVAVHQ